MGYRSTFITNEIYTDEIPEWFREKYQGAYNFGDVKDGSVVISSNWETKYYALQDDELFADISKLLKEIDVSYDIAGALVHEDGEVSRVIIGKDFVKVQHMQDGGENYQLGKDGVRRLDQAPQLNEEA